MQCTCPSYNSHNSHSLNRRRQHKEPSSTATTTSGVQWYSSQTLPNPKRRRTRTKDYNTCSCNSSSCVFSSHRNTIGRRNVIDPRSGNPVKSCLNLSTAAAASSRGSCYLCSRSHSVPRQLVLHDQQQYRQREAEDQIRHGLHNKENHPLGPYLVSNPPLVNNYNHQPRYSSNKSINSCPRAPSTEQLGA